MELFGSSGIRGIANREITPELALNIGLAVGSRYDSTVVGRDPRISSRMIESSIISGLLSAGCDAARAGLVTTPTLAFASRKYGCGIMVTASHNPPEYNGAKFWNKDGIAFNSNQQHEIEFAIESGEYKFADWDKMGRIYEEEHAIQEHAVEILKNFRETDLKVVVDCGSGAASTITPYVLREMGCQIFTLNAQPDGYFPGRSPEPVEENLGLLMSAVRSLKADLGIAHDGDGDRMMAVDDMGRFVSGDRLLALFGKREAKRSIVVPVDTSMVVDDTLKGIRIVRTKVGDVYVAEELKRINADFGGEASGSWIFPKVSYCPDGIYAAAYLVDIVSKEGKLSKLLEAFPTYPILRGSVKFPNKKKAKAMERITAELGKFGELNYLDGVRLSLDDGWVLVRPSGTEPKMRITVEARRGGKKLYKLAERIVRGAI